MSGTATTKANKTASAKRNDQGQEEAAGVAWGVCLRICSLPFCHLRLLTQLGNSQPCIHYGVSASYSCTRKLRIPAGPPSPTAERTREARNLFLRG